MSEENADTSASQTQQTEGNWYEKYGPEAAPILSRYKTPDDQVKGHLELRKQYGKLGKNPDALVEIPGENATPEQRKAFAARALELPDSPEKYEYALDPEIEKVVGAMDEEGLTHFRKFAYDELELSPAKFKKLMDFYYKYTADGVTKYSTRMEADAMKANEEAKAALKKEWKDAYDDKEARANLLIQKYGGAEFIDDRALHNDPKFIKFLDAIAEDMSEDRIKGLTRTTQLTASQIDAEITALRNSDAYKNRQNPGHAEAQKRMMELYQKKAS